MPRYHFHVHDGKSILNEEGIDLPDLKTVRMEAIHLAGSMLLDRASLVHAERGWHLSVAEAGGKPLLRVDVDIIDLTVLQ